MKVHTSVLVICLILAVVCSGAIKVLHHDRLDGFVANEHIDWTTSAQDFNTTGDITLGGYIDIPEMTIPGTPGTNYLRLYNEDIHGFSFFSFKDDTGMVRKLVRDSVIVVKNERGSAIAAGRIVYATGSENTVPTVDLAKADSSSTMPAIGVTLERIVDGAYGRVMQTGLLENVNTNSFSTGDVLYVSDTTAGIPKSTVPVTPSLSQEIGTILVSDSTAGQIQIVSRSVHQNETGTAQNTFLIGDGTSDGKTLTFNAITDGSIIWDETKFDLDGAPLYTSNSGQFGGGVAVGDANLNVFLEPDYENHIMFSGDGGYFDGLDIAVPKITGNDFYYGSGGTEHHYFGTNADAEITDDGEMYADTGFGIGVGGTLHLVADDDFVALTGDGEIQKVGGDGLQIAVPLEVGTGFNYGFRGTEHHFFGNTQQVEITDDGIVNAANFTAGTLTVSDGSIDDTDGSIAFGATNFTGVGTIIAASYNAITLAVNDLVIDDAANDNSLTVSGDWTIDQSVASGATPTFGADNFSDGGSNAIVTTTQETNWDNHIADNTQAHSDYLINDGNDSTSGILTAASFETVNYFDGGGFRHIGDLDTYCGLLTDRIVFFAGGNSMIESRWHVAVGAFRKITFNSGSADIDVEMRGDTDNNLLYLNAGTDRVGIGTATPAAKFDVVGDALISTTLGVTGESLFSDKVKFTQVDGNEYIDSLADGYMDIGATTAIRLNGLDDTADPKLIFVSDNEGSVTWMEDERYFLLDNALVAVRDDWIPPYISLQSTLSIAQSGGYTPMFESRMDTDGVDVETRLESTDALGRVGTNSAHDLDLITNSAARMTISAAGYVRVINRMMIGADAAPDYPLEVTGISRLGDGGATNYTQFAADGTQTMAGTAKVMVGEDIDIAIPKRPTANPPAEGTEDGFPTLDFDDGTDESILIVYHLKQNYASAGTFHVHVDYFVDTAPVGDANVVWGLEYKKQSHGDNFDFDAGSSTLTTTEAVTTGTPANNKKIHETTNFNLTTTGWVPHDIILMRLYRDANNLNDNFTGDARLIHIHVEFLSDKLGEAT